MKAVILAAGKGTRMGDLTQEIPKPMLRVQGRPILEHILEGLLAAGIRDVCLITGWRAVLLAPVTVSTGWIVIVMTVPICQL